MKGKTGRDKGCIPWNKGKSHSELTRKKISLATQGRIPWNKGLTKKLDIRIKATKGTKGYKPTEETRRKMSESRKKIWENPEYKNRVIKNTLKGLITRPTSLEKQFQAIIDKYSLPYRYVGDGSFLVGYKNPDFINIQYDSLGQKICIEVANRYHHPNPYKENRIKHFAKWGWKCIVFLGDELNEEEIVKQLR